MWWVCMFECILDAKLLCFEKNILLNVFEKLPKNLEFYTIIIKFFENFCKVR